MNFYDYDFDIKNVVLACKVLAGTGESVHRNRPSHGLAVNLGGEKKYDFFGKTLTVKENDIIFLPEGSNYNVENIKNGDCLAINFKLSSSADFEPFVCHPKNSREVISSFLCTLRYFISKKEGYTLMCKSELYKIIYEIVADYNRGYASSGKNKILLPATEYIHNHYFEKDFDVDFLAELCGIKGAYFRRLFLLCYGTSPVKYINNLKLSFAKELLSEKIHTVGEVSEIAGFNNESYFHRFFKRETGMTPAEYRKNRGKS